MHSSTDQGWGARAFAALSVTLLVLLHLACGLVLLFPPTWGLVGLALGSYLLRMWAITAGYHRYFAHRSYKTSRAFQLVLAVLGTSAMQNGPLWWASWHRRHHKDADGPDDPHSPRLGGFWRSHMGWFLDGSHDEPDLSNVRDLARYPELRFLDKHKWLPIVGYALLCFAIAGGAGLVWGFLVPTIAALHATALINSLAHVWGSRRYATRDDSRNNALLAVVTLGEGWHNNHHHYMSSARQGFRWYEVDATYYSLKVLSWLGVVWDLRQPPRTARSEPAVAARSRGAVPRPATAPPVPARALGPKGARAARDPSPFRHEAPRAEDPVRRPPTPRLARRVAGTLGRATRRAAQSCPAEGPTRQRATGQRASSERSTS